MPSVIIIASCGNEEVINPTQDDQVGKKVFESKEEFEAFKKNYGLAGEEVVEVKTVSSSTKTEQDLVFLTSSAMTKSVKTALFTKKTGVNLKSLATDGVLPVGTTAKISTALSDKFRSGLFRKYFSDSVRNYDQDQNIFCLEISPYQVFYTPQDLDIIRNAGYQIALMIKDYPDLKGNPTSADTDTPDKLFVDYVHLCMEKAEKVFFAEEKLYTRCRDDVEASQRVVSAKTPGATRKNLYSGAGNYKGFIGDIIRPQPPSLTTLNAKAYKFKEEEFLKASETKGESEIYQRIITARENQSLAYLRSFTKSEIGSPSANNAAMVVSTASSDWCVFPSYYFDANDEKAGNGILSHTQEGKECYDKLYKNAGYVNNYLSGFRAYFRACGYEIDDDKELKDYSHLLPKSSDSGPLKRSAHIAEEIESSDSGSETGDIDVDELADYKYYHDDPEKFGHVLQSLLGLTEGNRRILSGLTSVVQKQYFLRIEQFAKDCGYNRNHLDEYSKIFFKELSEICAGLQDSKEKTVKKDFAPEKQQKFKAVIEDRRAAEGAEAIAAKEEEARKVRDGAERKVREDAERQAREEADRKAREELERKAREETERKAREETERKAREEEERKAREEEERKAREEEERKAREETERSEREAKELALTLSKTAAKAVIEQIKADIAKAAASQGEAEGYEKEANRIAGEGEVEANQFENESSVDLARAAKAKALEARTAANVVKKNAADAKENAEKAKGFEEDFAGYLLRVEVALKADEVERILVEITNFAKDPVKKNMAAAEQNADEAKTNLDKVVEAREGVKTAIANASLDKEKSEEEKEKEKARKAKEEEARKEQERKAKEEQERKAKEEQERKERERLEKEAQEQALKVLKDDAFKKGEAALHDIDKALSSKARANGYDAQAQTLAGEADADANEYEKKNGNAADANVKAAAVRAKSLASEVKKNAKDTAQNADEAKKLEEALNYALLQSQDSPDPAKVRAAFLKIGEIADKVKEFARLAGQHAASAKTNLTSVEDQRKFIAGELAKALVPPPPPPPAKDEISYVEDRFVAIRKTPGTKETPGTVIKLSLAVAATSVIAPFAAKAVTEGQYRVIGAIYSDPATDKIDHKEVVNTIVGIIATVSNELGIDQAEFFAGIDTIRKEGGAANKQVAKKGAERIFAERENTDASISDEMKQFSTLFQKYAFQCGIYDGSKMGDVLKEMPGFRLCNIDKEVLDIVTVKKDEIFAGGTNVPAMQLHVDQVDKSMKETAKIIPLDIFNEANNPGGQKFSRKDLTTIVR